MYLHLLSSHFLKASIEELVENIRKENLDATDDWSLGVDSHRTTMSNGHAASESKSDDSSSRRYSPDDKISQLGEVKQVSEQVPLTGRTLELSNNCLRVKGVEENGRMIHLSYIDMHRILRPNGNFRNTQFSFEDFRNYYLRCFVPEPIRPGTLKEGYGTVIRALNSRTNETKGLTVLMENECKKSAGDRNAICKAWNNPWEYAKEGKAHFFVLG